MHKRDFVTADYCYSFFFGCLFVCWILFVYVCMERHEETVLVCICMSTWQIMILVVLLYPLPSDDDVTCAQWIHATVTILSNAIHVIMHITIVQSLESIR